MTQISDNHKVCFCFENRATDGSLSLFFFPILDENYEKGTFRLSVINLVSMDNS